MKSELRNWNHGLLSAFASTVIALGAGCNAKHSQTAQPSSFENVATLRRGLGGEPGTLDPGAAADSFSLEVLGDLYEGLTAESADGTVVPGVAASWIVDPTGTRYEFYLRPDARWSNGAPVRAQHFVTVVGYMTHNSDDTTIKHAFDAELRVEFLMDASGSVSYANRAGFASAEEIHRVFSVVQQSRFAIVVTTAEWLECVAKATILERGTIHSSHLQAQSVIARRTAA
jgi:hypothetical protein